MGLNLFRVLGDLSHLVSIGILLHKMIQLKSCSGISFKSQVLYFIVYITRYLGTSFSLALSLSLSLSLSVRPSSCAIFSWPLMTITNL